MIDHVWRERIALCDRLIAVDPGAERAFRAARRLAAWRYRGRAAAKRLRHLMAGAPRRRPSHRFGSKARRRLGSAKARTGVRMAVKNPGDSVASALHALQLSEACALLEQKRPRPDTARRVTTRKNHKTWFSAWPSAICWLTEKKRRRSELALRLEPSRGTVATGTGKMRTLFLINKRKNLPGKPS
jgi:hypothetical protein